MPIVTQLHQWWNLIYFLPFSLGVFLVLLSVLNTGGRHSRSTHRTRAGQSSRTNFKAAGHRHASTVQTKSAQPTRAVNGRQSSTRQHNGPSKARQLWRRSTQGFGVLHFENLPPLMVLQNFLLFWGVFGWAVNQYFVSRLADPAVFIVSSLLITSASSLLVTIVLSAVLSRLTPTDETYAATKRDLIGRAGEAMSAITNRMGSVYVRDATGTLHHLPVRIQEGGLPIAKGKSVLVIDYDSQNDFYWVKEWSPDTIDLTILLHTTEPPDTAHYEPLHAQTDKPYRAWRWLVGSNPP